MTFTPINATFSIGSILALIVLVVVIILSPLIMGQLDGRMALLIGTLALARLL
jgi:hypothetical protein